MKKHLQPVRPAPRIERLVRDLGSADYEARERATKQLADLGEKAEYALRAALLGGTDLEVRRRVPLGGCRSQMDSCGKMEPPPSMTLIRERMWDR